MHPVQILHYSRAMQTMVQRIARLQQEGQRAPAHLEAIHNLDLFI